MRYLAYYRVATTQQLVYRFFMLAGKGPRYGFELIKRMASEGTISVRPLHPEKGSVSRNIVFLAEPGWALLGRRVSPLLNRTLNDPRLLNYSLQYVDVMLEREATGWTNLLGHRAFQAMQRWALASYRSKALTETEMVIRERLERMPAFDPGLRVLYHEASQNVRLVLPVRPGKDYNASLEQVPPMPLFGPLPFELISADPVLAAKAVKRLMLWASKRKTTVIVAQAESYLKRPNPASVPTLKSSVYKQHGVKDPRSLI